MSFSFRPLLRITRTLPVSIRPSPIQFRSLVTKRYTIDHEWISYDDATSIGTIGITEYAQKALGDVVYVELPSVSTACTAGEQIGAVESVKAASDIFAPVSGEITEINETLGDSPGLLNKSAEESGWLAKIKLSDSTEFNALLDEAAYTAHCSGETESH